MQAGTRNLKTQAAAWARRLAFVFFSLGFVLIPFRLRAILLSRPQGAIYRDYTDFLLFASDISFLLALIFWLFSLALSRRRVVLGPGFILVPLGGVMLLGLISVLTSVDRALSLYHLIRLIFLAGLYVYIVNEIRTLKVLALPAAIQVGLQSSIGLVQSLTQSSLGLAGLGELALDPKWPGVSIVSAGGVRYLRAYGLSDHPNILGGSLAFGLLLVLLGYLQANERWRTPLAAIFILGCLGLMYTFSRAAWLAFGAALLWTAFWVARRHRTSLPGLAGLVLAALVLAVPFIWVNLPYLGVRLNANRSFTTVPQEVQSLGERTLLNQATNQVFGKHAVLGIGLGALPAAMSREFPDFPVDYQPAHIVLLDVAAEIGLLGASFYLILVIAPWLAMLIARKRLRFSIELVIASGLVLAITVIGLFDYYPWLLAPGRYWQWIIWGLWAVAYREDLKAGFDD